MVHMVYFVHFLVILSHAELLSDLVDDFSFKIIMEFLVGLYSCHELFITVFSHVEQINVFKWLVELFDLSRINQGEQTPILLEVELVLLDLFDTRLEQAELIFQIFDLFVSGFQGADLSVHVLYSISRQRTVLGSDILLALRVELLDIREHILNAGSVSFEALRTHFEQLLISPYLDDRALDILAQSLEEVSYVSRWVSSYLLKQLAELSSHIRNGLLNIIHCVRCQQLSDGDLLHKSVDLLDTTVEVDKVNLILEVHGRCELLFVLKYVQNCLSVFRLNSSVKVSDLL